MVEGAQFLLREEVEWQRLPNNPVSRNTVQEEANKELSKGNSSEISSLLNLTVQAPHCISEAIQPDKFSSISKLIRVTALVLKFIKRVRRSPGTCPDIAMDEVNAAKILWYKHLQTKLEEREKCSSTCEQLGVLIDEDGVLRCRGGIQNSSLPYSATGKQHFAKLVIRQCHENVNHNGVGETLGEI